MGYRSNWSQAMKNWQKQNQTGTTTHVPAVGLPKNVEWSALGQKVYKDTGSRATDIMGKTIANTKKQSGDDWGMEDDDDLFGTDIMDMDPHSEEFAAAVAADTAKGPPSIPGDTNSQGWSSDFTDSGIQSSTDPEDAEEDAYERSLLRRGKGKGHLAAEGASPKAGTLRRSIQAKKSLITGGA